MALSDKKKKKIIADYINTQNKCETARMNGVSESTVRAILKRENSSEIARKCEEKKEENTQDILEYMNDITEKQKNIINLSLNALEEKLQKPDMFMNVKDIATVYGVIFDKALKYKEIKMKNREVDNGITKVNELLSKIEKEANK